MPLSDVPKRSSVSFTLFSRVSDQFQSQEKQFLLPSDMYAYVFGNWDKSPQTKVLDKQSQLMNSPCGDPNKELNHKEENQ